MTPNTITFSSTDSTWVMRITADRRIEVNEDVDVTEAAQKVLDAMQHLLKPAPVQEPVATVTSESENPDVTMSWWHEPPLPVGTKLYTTPTAQPAPTVQEPVRDYSCKVCSNKPDADGWLEHGRGCYTQSEDGGGSEFISDSVTPPAAQPAVPDAFGTREGEHPQYVQGWNDCRAEMLEMRKP